MNYGSYYNYYSPSVDTFSTTAFGILGALMLIIWIIAMGVIVLSIIALWKIFKKSGEKGWKSIIPVYNLITVFKIVGLNPLLVLVYLATLIPFIGSFAALTMNVILMIYLAKAFGKSGGFAVGLIFLGPIFLCILAFGKDEYIGTPYDTSNL